MLTSVVLIARVEDAEQRGRNQGQHHHDHGPLQVNLVAHMRRAVGDLGRGEQEGFVGFVQGVQALKLPAGQEERPHLAPSAFRGTSSRQIPSFSTSFRFPSG
jgi:hypothetical protein